MVCCCIAAHRVKLFVMEGWKECEGGWLTLKQHFFRHDTVVVAQPKTELVLHC